MLKEKAGSGKILVIDCQTAGVAGDMLLGALIDAGADVNKVTAAIKTLEAPKAATATSKSPSTSHAWRVQSHPNRCHRRNPRQNQGTANGGNRRKNRSEPATFPKAQQFASNAVRTLVNAEAKLHGNGLEDAHLHEVGLVDTPAEILGTAVALEDLGLFDAEAKIWGTPVAVGGGTLKFSHGTVSIPAPATLAILQSKNYPFKGGPIEAELATPTGAAILVNLVDEASPFYPVLAPLKVGYGAGTKEFKEMPNCLRIVIGEAVNGELLKDEIVVLETNLDDVTGEVVGYTFDRLLEEGAKDVIVIPVLTKKNRPAQILRVIADKKDAAHLSRVIMEETGTLGIRLTTSERHILNRELHQVDIFIKDQQERVNVKVVKDSHGKIVHVKPEFEDLKRIAQKTGLPLREVAQAATAKAHEIFLRK
jgi:uncharacterized protein (TIGR00299 family) protein